MDIESVKKAAKEELRQEEFRAAVDKYKEKLKNKRKIFNRIFPWKIIIVRKDKI